MLGANAVIAISSDMRVLIYVLLVLSNRLYHPKKTLQVKRWIRFSGGKISVGFILDLS